MPRHSNHIFLADAFHPLRLFRISVEKYQRIVEFGVLTSQDRCHLIWGLLIEKPRMTPRHSSALTRLHRRLTKLLGHEVIIGIQQAITLPPDSQPEPDLAILAGTEDDYSHRHPVRKEILLAVEVSDTSLEEDRTVYLALYAAHKLPVCWIVNVRDRQVEVYTDPKGGKAPTYRTRTDYGPDDAVPVALAGKSLGSIPVRELLP